jgi:CDP-diacylglycerol--glycerol-3-phosphate 3-phosphatidyltransferase
VEQPGVGSRRDAGTRAAEAAERARLTFRRLAGLDRSGPPPPETRAGAPLRPWTLPNAIGYVRLALLPVFMLLAFRADGKSTAGAIIYALVAWSDYVDGIVARLTGQYSRLGTLMDPVIDRLLVLSGAFVCLWFDLLPRWALAVLAVREVFVFGLARWGLRHGFDIRVNWLGRAGVWPVFSALFFAMVGLEDLGTICLYVGLAVVLASAVQYWRDGLAQRRAKPSTRD